MLDKKSTIKFAPHLIAAFIGLLGLVAVKPVAIIASVAEIDIFVRNPVAS